MPVRLGGLIKAGAKKVSHIRLKKISLKKLVFGLNVLSVVTAAAVMIGTLVWWNSLRANIQADQGKGETYSQSAPAEGGDNNTPASASVPAANVAVLTLQDFPSPVDSEPIRGSGTYYSDDLKAYLYHGGQDYALAEGSIIRATHGGKVSFAGYDPLLGQKVCLDAGQGWEVVYGGLDNLRVKAGDEVATGDILGQVGFSSGLEGKEGQSQLHYEVSQHLPIEDIP